MTEGVVLEYLDLLDSQREAVFASMEGLSEEQIWQRPGPKEWSIGEILSHTDRFLNSFQPSLRFMWKAVGWYGRLRRKRPNFPMWTGFLWNPPNTPEKPLPLAQMKTAIESTHAEIRAFYTDKDPDVLGNINAYDPAIGVVNLITGLRVCIDHDQLHYDDVLQMAASLKEGESAKGL
jgi:hypothetical protein